jgi:hypothetical protein
MKREVAGAVDKPRRAEETDVDDDRCQDNLYNSLRPQANFPEVDQADLFLARPRDPERFSYAVEIEPGAESERSQKSNFYH